MFVCIATHGLLSPDASSNVVRLRCLHGSRGRPYMWICNSIQKACKVEPTRRRLDNLLRQLVRDWWSVIVRDRWNFHHSSLHYTSLERSRIEFIRGKSV